MCLTLPIILHSHDYQDKDCEWIYTPYLHLQDKSLIPDDEHFGKWWRDLWKIKYDWGTEIPKERSYAVQFKAITGMDYKHSFRWDIPQIAGVDPKDKWSKENINARWSKSKLETSFPYFKEQFEIL